MRGFEGQGICSEYGPCKSAPVFVYPFDYLLTHAHKLFYFSMLDGDPPPNCTLRMSHIDHQIAAAVPILHRSIGTGSEKIARAAAMGLHSENGDN